MITLNHFLIHVVYYYPKNNNWYLFRCLIFDFIQCWTLDVSRAASYEITLVRLSVRPSFTKCSKDWIISFFWYCTWWLLTMISSDWRRQIFEKNIVDPNLDQRDKNYAQNYIFCYSLMFDTLAFLKIAYSDSL